MNGRSPRYSVGYIADPEEAAAIRRLLRPLFTVHR